MGTRYFEDIELHAREELGEYVVDRDEVIEFSKKWDPAPIHIDEEAAKASIYGDIIAPFGYAIGIIQRMVHQRDLKAAGMGGLGMDNVRFPHMVRPGDVILVTVQCIDKRESNSRRDLGIVRYAVEVTNQHGESCLTYESTVLIQKRPL